MSEPNEAQAFDSEESEALSIASEVAGEGWQDGDTGIDSAAEPAPGEVHPPAQTVSPVEQSPSLTLEQARQRFQQANATRAQLRDYAQQQWEAAQAAQQERGQMEAMLNAFLQAQRQEQQPQQLEPQIDPDLQRYLDSQNQALLARMEQMLQPALSLAQQQQQMQEVQQQVTQEQAQWTEFRNIVEQDEQNYLQTPEGQGYNERLVGFQGAMMDALASSGVAEPVAQKLVTEELKGVTMIAMSLGQSPAYFMDNYAKALLRWAGNHVNGNGQPVNGNRQVQRQQGRVSPQVQIARMATQAGAVGAPPGSGATTSNGLTAADLINRRLTDKDISALVKEHGSLDKAIRYLENVGVELDQILG